MSFKSDFLRVMDERGFLNQLSDPSATDALFTGGGVRAYIGFDPTASSLHVGSLIQIMVLHWLKKTGNTPVVVLGGATGLVGDPSFKNTARTMLSEDTVDNNLNSIKGIFTRVLGEDTTILNNAAWVLPIDLMTFLRDVGSHFNVNQMLKFDSVKSRIEDGGSLSFLEFSYMLLQAFDFVALHENHNVKVQIGGSDQWGNIVNGIHLGQRMHGVDLFGITTPLLTNSNGEKMGKTANGAVWINEELLSNFDFWQFWRNVDDADVHRFLKLFTEIPVSDIDAMTDPNTAKITLASHVTRFVRGQEALEEALRAVDAAFGTTSGFGGLPSFTVPKTATVAHALHTAGFVDSVNAGRRAITGNGVRVNDETVIDPNHPVPDGEWKLSFGKKKHAHITTNV